MSPSSDRHTHAGVDPSISSVTGGVAEPDHSPTAVGARPPSPTQAWWDRLWLTAVILIALGGTVMLSGRIAAERQAQVNAMEGRAAAPSFVHVMPIERSVYSRVIRADGVTAPFERRVLAFETGGTIAELFAVEHGTVEPGAPVMVLDRAPLEHAALAADARYAQALAARDIAAKEVERGRTLRSRETIDQSQLDRLESQADLAEAELAAAEARLREADRQRRAAVLVNVFDVQAIVTHVFKRPGERVAPGEPVAELQVQHPLKCIVQVGQRQYRELLASRPPQTESLNGAFPDLPIQARVSFGPDRSRRARLFALGRDVDPRSRQFPVQFAFDNADGQHVAGEFVTVEMTLPATELQIRILKTATVTRFDVHYAYVAVIKVAETAESRDEAGAAPRLRATRRRITVTEIWDDPAHYIVTSGLAVGDSLILGPLAGLRDDRPVRLKRK